MPQTVSSCLQAVPIGVQTHKKIPGKAPTQEKGVVSSGVTFVPQGRYWRIGNKYYDLTDFADSGRHPGGRQLLYLARDRFSDSTYAFEAHHTNQPLVRRMLAQYEVPGVVPPQPDNPNERLPNLSAESTFYYVLRERMHAHLKAHGGPGPTDDCLRLWWLSLTAWVALFLSMCKCGSFALAVPLGLVSAVVGGYGHNWVHQPKYRLYAFSLDLVGFSSEAWVREHLLQHHMYTNTPLDNHFRGTEPFLVADPGCKRSWVQKYLFPTLTPVVIFFGMLGNNVLHTVELLKGRENFSVGKLLMPLEIAIMIYFWGPLRGLLLIVLSSGICSVWYFSISLMNHNTEHCWDLQAKRQAGDWGHSQLNASADLEPGLDFFSSWKYLWLNFHTIHHLFPHTDMSKHPGMQRVLMETLKDFPEVKYETSNFGTCYREMIETFSSPRHPGEIVRIFPQNGI